ncbi:hypothetical protein C8R47DRAFT_1204880 [Mycena vitilis]|nr:hypothetical protein C8R47DRAFT_1204880 [Mycena vitilis]
MATTRTLPSLTVAHPSTPSVLSHLTTLLLFPPPPPLTAPEMRHPRHISKSLCPIRAAFRIHHVRVAATGWIGLADNGVAPAKEEAGVVEDGPEHLLSDFFGPTATIPGFTLVPFTSSEERPILDAADRVVAVIGGMPDDPDFMANIHDPAVEAMESSRSQASVSEERQSHRRGAEWAPNLFSFYVDYMGRFHRHYPDLHRPFANGIFSTCTFNLGPRTCALGHRNFVNFALGWVAISFSGIATILIPSAAVFHSKSPIAPHEHRYSFTQYTAGGLFRWVEHGFKSEEDYFASLSAEGCREEKILGRQRAAAAADMFSTIAELRAMDV